MSTTQTCRRCGAEFAGDPSTQPTCPKCLMELGMQVSSLWVTGSGAPAGPPPDPEAIEALCPEYEVRGVLGQGGMGVVYRGLHKRLQRPVALKVLPPELQPDASFPARFEREARALAGLSHPGITTLYDFGEAEGTCWFAMELVDGVNLRELMRTRELNPTQALDIVGQVCEALQYAHKAGVVHRDIKPESVLVDREGRVKITDFGLAKVVDSDGAPRGLTATFQVMGTPHYMAPEQVERPAAVDHRADIYSLGVVFYELLTGELPIGRFDAPSERVSVDVRLDEVVLRTLAKEPERRYQDAASMGGDVTRIASSPHAAPRARAKSRPSSRRAPSAGLRAFAVMAGVILAVLAFGLLSMLLLPARSGEDGLGQDTFALEGPAPMAPPSELEEERSRGESIADALSYQESLIQWSPTGAPYLHDEVKRLFHNAFLNDNGSARAERIEQEIIAVFDEYLELEAEQRTVRVEDGGVLHIEVEPFATERAALLMRLQSVVDEQLEESGTLPVLSLFGQELMPFGQQSTEVRLRRDAGGQFVADVRVGASNRRSPAIPELGRGHLFRLWAQVVDLPSSAYEALTYVLELLAPELDAGELELRRVESDQGRRSDRLRVRLDLHIALADAVEASRLVDELRQRVGASERCLQVEIGNTTQESGTGGLLLDSFEVEVAAPDDYTLLQALPRRDTVNLEPRIRGAAQGLPEELGAIDVLRNTFTPNSALEAQEYVVRLRDQPRLQQLETAWTYLSALEAGEPRAIVNRLDLSLAPAPDDPNAIGWRLNVQLGAMTRKGN